MLRRSAVPLIIATALLSACAGGGAGGGSSIPVVQSTLPPPPPVSHFREFALPPSGNIPAGAPSGIAFGPDGNLWFADIATSAIGRITPTGHISEFPSGLALTGGVVAGSDGNLWFTARGYLGRITPDGIVSQFPLTAPVPFLSSTLSVTSGPDQNLWFTGSICTVRRWWGCGARYAVVGRMSIDGRVTEFANANGAGQITTGSDGNLWFTENHAIGRMATNGTVLNEFQVAMPTVTDALGGIAAGPDGALWFTRSDQGAFGDESIFKVTTAGAMSAMPLSHADASLAGVMAITLGPDANMWFTDSWHNAIGSVTPAGKITEYPIPTALSGASAITAGPNGTMWFTENAVGKIGVYQI